MNIQIRIVFQRNENFHMYFHMYFEFRRCDLIKISNNLEYVNNLSENHFIVGILFLLFEYSIKFC